METRQAMGAFAELQALEHAYQRLRAQGVPAEAMEVEWLERCAACEEEEARGLEPATARALGFSQALGALGGMVLGGAGMSPDTWSQALISLLALGCWAAGGAILGALVGGLALELRPRVRPEHRHALLKVAPGAMPPADQSPK